jgi:hypothetical protein
MNDTLFKKLSHFADKRLTLWEQLTFKKQMHVTTFDASE